jgi:hypothetical protein
MTQEGLHNTRKEMLDSFLRTVIHDLDHLDENRMISSLSDLRQHILQIQQVALRDTARQYQVSEEVFLTAIQNSSSSSSEQLNLVARRAFCRVVLHMDLNKVVIPTNGSPTDNDILEFLGLMITAYDEGFIGTTHSKDMAQEIFWKALGYDSVLANQSLQNRVHENNDPGAQLILETYQTMIRKLQDDGVTRVVAVQYSEFNPVGTTNMDDDTVPRSSTMDRTTCASQNDQVQQQPSVPQQMETLRHKIMQEIQSMQQSERDILIQHARETAESVLAKVSRPYLSMEQRMLLLTSLDEETQRLMIIDKLWQRESSSIENR